MRRFSRRRKKRPAGLMLTSLLDMFTIILIFLLVSFEAEDYDFQLNPGLKLPESSARSVFKPAVNVAVTRDGVFIGETRLAALAEGRATEDEYAAERLAGVVDALKLRLEADAESGEGEPDDEDGPIVLLQADRDMDYRTLYLVMRSAREAGYARFRLAVLKK